LWDSVTTAWDNITKAIYPKLIDNMSRRVAEVIRTKESHTKYWKCRDCVG
ncbi:hypothetical protein P692DRAFT_20754732, partial [Suillus brevipes Sb2]